MSNFYLAQINIARMLYPLEDPRMAGFVNRLDEINALADDAPGFVWRLQSETGNATDLRPYDDDFIIVNMSVWESVEALKTYTYKSLHVELLRDRKLWFEHMGQPASVMWWIPVGHVPTPIEGRDKLNLLEEIGATAAAFTFKEVFLPE